jgi:ABC-type multidrug transport system fused ATPase/permease subunit
VINRGPIQSVWFMNGNPSEGFPFILNSSSAHCYDCVGLTIRSPAIVSPAASSSSPPPLQVVSLIKRYGQVTAVDNISLELRPGECLGLLGPNGAGKSTLIRAIAGRVIADSGQITVFGAPAGSPAKTCAPSAATTASPANRSPTPSHGVCSGPLLKTAGMISRAHFREA